MEDEESGAREPRGGLTRNLSGEEVWTLKATGSVACSERRRRSTRHLELGSKSMTTSSSATSRSGGSGGVAALLLVVESAAIGAGLAAAISWMGAQDTTLGVGVEARNGGWQGLPTTDDAFELHASRSNIIMLNFLCQSGMVDR